MGPQRPRNGRQIDGNIPPLPRAIKTLAGTLRGGPFASNGMILHVIMALGASTLLY